MKNPVDSPTPTYVTRDEFDALTRTVGAVLAATELAHSRAGYSDGHISTQLELAERVPGMATAERAALKAITKSFDATMAAHHAAERQRTHERGNAYHRVSG